MKKRGFFSALECKNNILYNWFPYTYKIEYFEILKMFTSNKVCLKLKSL